MASGGSGAAGGKAERSKRANTDAQRSPKYPYDYITLPGGDRFDIPEGEDKEEWIPFFDEARRATREVIARYGDGRPADGVNSAAILPSSSHRDGSVYGVSDGWHRDYRISDRGETRLEPRCPSRTRQVACPIKKIASFTPRDP